MRRPAPRLELPAIDRPTCLPCVRIKQGLCHPQLRESWWDVAHFEPKADLCLGLGIRQAYCSKDEAHSERLLLIGVSEKSRVLYTVFAELADDVVRTSAKRVKKEGILLVHDAPSPASLKAIPVVAAKRRLIISTHPSTTQ